MARAKTQKSETVTFVAAKAIDLIVPMGFVVAVDSDLSLRDNEKPTKQRLEHAADTMFARYEDKILTALKSVFGERVSYLETAEPYTGDPISGVMRKIHVETPIPAAAPAVPPPAPVQNGNGKGKGKETLVGTALTDYAALTVADLKGLCKDRELKTLGMKAQLVKRLQAYDAKHAA